MNTTPITKIARLAMALVLFTGTAGSVIGGQSSTTKSTVPKMIELHAPNNATSSVTIWTPQTTRVSEKSAVAKSNTAGVIDLPASNNPASTITVWRHVEGLTKGTDKKLDVAPFK